MDAAMMDAFRRSMEAVMEDARVAGANYAKNPFDAHNLTNWGKALLQLSFLKDGQDSKKTREDAISKLLEAIELDPFKQDALWLLGKCFSISALKTPDSDEIKSYLHKALAYFKKASFVDPGNQMYITFVQQVTKVLETDKELHANVEMDKDTHSDAEMDNELHTNVEMNMDIQTKAEMDKGIHTNAELDRAIRTEVEMNDDIHTNAEMDKDIHTNTEMGMDINIIAEMNKSIHTNAFDNQLIDAASSKVKSSKESSDLKK